MNALRSFLFVPADSPRKIAKALASDADAVILDLEDSVAPANKPNARLIVAEVLAKPRDRQIWVRINPFNSGHMQDDLAAITGALPDGVVQPKASGPVDVSRLSDLLDDIDADGFVNILPIVTETPTATLRLHHFAEADLPRLWGLTWGAEDLATELGASDNKDADGNWLPVFETVRSMTLLAARAAGVEPIDTLSADFGNPQGLLAQSQTSATEGFTGRLAIHPAQIAPVNVAYTPSIATITHAHRVLAAFAAQPDAGVVGLDGKMLDIPHLKQARAIIARAADFGVDEAGTPVMP